MPFVENNEWMELNKFRGDLITEYEQILLDIMHGKMRIINIFQNKRTINI